MANIYSKLGFDSEFDVIYENDFPEKRKKEMSRKEFSERASKLVSEGFPRKHLLQVMARTDFDFDAIEMVFEACKQDGSKMNVESIEPLVFSAHDAGVIAGLVWYISKNYSKGFVTGTLHNDEIRPKEGGDYLSAVNDWIEKEEKYYQDLDNYWTAYFTAEKREKSDKPKIVVGSRESYENDEQYLADAMACIRGIEPMEVFRGENIYAKAKALRLGGNPRLEKYLLRNTMGGVSDYNCKRQVVEFFNGD